MNRILTVLLAAVGTTAVVAPSTGPATASGPPPTITVTVGDRAGDAENASDLPKRPARAADVRRVTFRIHRQAPHPHVTVRFMTAGMIGPKSRFYQFYEVTTGDDNSLYYRFFGRGNGKVHAVTFDRGGSYPLACERLRARRVTGAVVMQIPLSCMPQRRERLYAGVKIALRAGDGLVTWDYTKQTRVVPLFPLP